MGNACSLLADAIGIGGAVAETLALSGRLHDEGKAAPRFQELLHMNSDFSLGVVLAKSAVQNRSLLMRERERLDLVGWRHEQLSAAIAWDNLKGKGSRELVTRLAGASHGRG